MPGAAPTDASPLAAAASGGLAFHNEGQVLAVTSASVAHVNVALAAAGNGSSSGTGYGENGEVLPIHFRPNLVLSWGPAAPGASPFPEHNWQSLQFT